MNTMKKLLGALLFAASVLVTTHAGALTLSFDSITNNNPIDVAIGESQLSVNVSDLGAGSVLFTFNNSGPAASSVAEIYFDNGSPGSTLDAISAILNGTGVNFVQGASPPSLPGGSSITPAFVVTAGLLAEATSPAPFRGINPGETLGVSFALQSGKSFADVIGDLNTGALRIGMHVIAFNTGGSESFVNVTPIPEPEIYAMMGLGLGLMGFVARRRRAGR